MLGKFVSAVVLLGSVLVVALTLADHADLPVALFTGLLLATGSAVLLFAYNLLSGLSPADQFDGPMKTMRRGLD
jgi:hypothetical protein